MNLNTGRRQFFQKSLAIGGTAVLARPFAGSALAGMGSGAAGSNETLKTLHSLRTIHGNFTDQEIPSNQIDEILSAGVRAANASALQSYSIIVVRDREKMQQVCGYRGSCMFVFCVDYNRITDLAENLKYEYNPEGTTSFVTGCVTTTLAAQTVVVAAKSMGIDSLITNGVHRGDMERHWKLLDLPEKYCFPLIAVVMGYPKEEPDYLKGRFQAEGVVHKEKYSRLTDAEKNAMVLEYDDPDRHLGLNDNWKKDGLKHYLDWLFGVWHKRFSHPLDKESQLSKILKRSGFVDLQRS